jgi:hypothetical protein
VACHNNRSGPKRVEEATGSLGIALERRLVDWVGLTVPWQINGQNLQRVAEVLELKAP